MSQKHILLVLLIGIAIVSCSKRNKYVSTELVFPEESIQTEEMIQDALPINILDSLHLEDTLGDVIEYEYEGLLPSADGPGIQYELTLWGQERSKEGVFSLSTTYLQDHAVDANTFLTVGKKRTIHRKHTDRDEVIYELIPTDGTSPLYFYVEGEDLTMLNQAMEHISSNHNYTLKRVR